MLTFQLDSRAPGWLAQFQRGDSITAESARGEDHPSYIISVAQHKATLRMLAARCQELVKDACMRWAYIAISRTARCVDATQVEASSLTNFPGGALVMSKHVNGVFSHVATTKTVYDKDIGHCLSRTGLVHAKAGLVDSMRKAREEGEVANRAVSSSTQRGCSRRRQF